jgi:predicted site-specific integrase-resolvase
MTKQGELNFNEASQVLGRSKRTITRYIKKGLLNPDKVKTEKGMILINL